MLKKIIKKIVHSFGIDIVKLGAAEKPVIHGYTMLNLLKRCSEKSLEISTVIDIGASDGRWARECMQHYPKAFYYLVDANNVHENNLKAFTAELSNTDYIIAAAGHEIGEIYFDNTDAHGGLATKTKFEGNCIVVPVTTIDFEVEQKNLKAPYLIKLDTHGFEVPILEGAKKSLQQANAVIIEVYNFKLTDTSLRFYEMCQYMDNLGFYPIDIADPMWRKLDNSFWQMDILFIKKERKEFLQNTYD